MRKQLLIVLIIVISLFTNTQYIKATKNTNDNNAQGKTFFETFKPEDLEIAGIRLGMRGSDVIKIFGKPLKKDRISETSFQNPDYMYYSEIWNYKDLDIYFNASIKKSKTILDKNFSVNGITIKSGTYQTKRGIKVGDSLEKIILKYGESEEPGIYRINLTYINFNVAYDGTVMQIDIGSETD